MELLQLRYFYESAKSESFAKTAEKYMVPTTSVSASVKRLEKELGTELFDRSCNRITLNANGKRLQRSLCLAFLELDKTVGIFAAQKTDYRDVKILVRSMRRKITDCIIKYNARYPQIAFKTVFDFREKNFEAYDIIIDEETDAYPQYEKFELYSMRLRIKSASGSPLCGRKLILKELSNQKFVSMGAESNLHKVLINACRRAGFTPDISILCNDIECYEKFIAAGMGIAVGREKSDPAEEQGVEYLDVTDFDARYTIYSYYKKESYFGNVKSFLDFLKSNTD